MSRQEIFLTSFDVKLERGLYFTKVFGPSMPSNTVSACSCGRVNFDVPMLEAQEEAWSQELSLPCIVLRLRPKANVTYLDHWDSHAGARALILALPRDPGTVILELLAQWPDLQLLKCVLV